MENYRKYFTGEEELLFKLEQLHRKKQKLKELLDNKKEINPFVVELCGLPRTGKTVSLGKLYEFFKNGGINIEKAEEPAFIIKNSLTLDEIKGMSNLEFNDKTLEVSRKSLERAKKKNSDIILMDRGIIDNYFWYQMLYEEGKISEEIYSDRLESLNDDFKLVNNLFIMKADPEIIIYRDYINSLYLEKRNKTTLERVSNLEKGLEHLLPNISDYEKVDIIDTTNTNAMGTSIILANTIMDNMQKKLELK